MSPSFCSCHLSDTSSTPFSAPTASERWVMMFGRGGYTCALSRARHLLSGRYCVCVFTPFFFFHCTEEFVEWPCQILPPPRVLGCWHVDKSSCLSQPCALIRSSTSKDWIMACCPHACRSLPCCRTAGDRQSELNLRASGIREKKIKKPSMQSAGDGRMTCLHWHLHNGDTLVHILHNIYHCGVSLWFSHGYWWAEIHALHMGISNGFSEILPLYVSSCCTFSAFKSTCIEAYFFFFWQERVNPLSLSFKCLVNRIWWTKALWSRKQKCGEQRWASFLLPSWRWTSLWNSLSAPAPSATACLQIIRGWQFYNSAGKMRLYLTI